MRGLVTSKVFCFCGRCTESAKDSKSNPEDFGFALYFQREKMWQFWNTSPGNVPV